MQSQKSIEIQRLRGIILDDSESPVDRLVAARRLLSRYGPSERNVPVIRRVIKLFERDANADVGDRCLKLKGQLLKRLDLQEVASVPLEDDADDQPEATRDVVSGPSAEDMRPVAAILPDKVEFPWPPTQFVWPPPTNLYTLGSIDMIQVAPRLLRAGLRYATPTLTSHEVNQAIVRSSLDLPAGTEITLEILQRVFYGLRYEKQAEDFAMAGDRFRLWPYARLFAAVWFLGLKFGYGSLKEPPSASLNH